MSNFVVIGSSNATSANRSAVFREIVEGRVPEASYLGIEALFSGNPMVYRIATSRKLMLFMQHHPRLLPHYECLIDTLYREGGRLNLHKLKSLLMEGKENYLIFCHGTRIDRISGATLQALRNSFPGCQMIYYLVDSIERTSYMNRLSVEQTLNYLRLFDFAYTYDRTDAQAYSDTVRFIEIPLWRSTATPPAIPESELYFCGKDKLRRELLMAIYDRLQAAGLRCHYRVVASTKAGKQRVGITLSDWTPYETVVNELLTCNCVLEILAVHNSESTLRYKEAVLYNKKLLTNNANISKLPYYDPRWMRTFRTAEDIDLDWLRAVEPVDYGYRGDYSVETFLRRVEELSSDMPTDSKPE